MARKLWTHQKEAIEIAKDRDYYGLIFDPGTGKTATAIEIYRQWCLQEDSLLPGIIFCPPVVIKNWKDEFSVWSKIPQDKIILLNQSGAKRAKIIRENIGKKVIFVTNYESLTMGSSKIGTGRRAKYVPGPTFQAMMEFISNHKAKTCIIYDEVHKLKNYKAQRTKQAIKLSDQNDKHLGLTGTAILKNHQDLFSQFRCITKGDTNIFGKHFVIFRNRYFFDQNAGMPSHRYFPNWQPIPSMYSDLQKRLAIASMAKKKEECLDLPPLVVQRVEVSLSPEQQRLYDEMKEDLITFIGQGKAAVANIALTKALRLQQIVSGFVNWEDVDMNKGIHICKDVPRLNALKDVVDNITPGHKMIIWAVFKHNYEQIGRMLQKMKIEYVELHGGVSGKKRDENIERFKTDPKVRVIMGHPMSGGIGVNLQEASYSCWFSRDFNLEGYLQARARNYRGGSEIHKKVTEIHLVAPGTCDEAVAESLLTKMESADNIIHKNPFANPQAILDML